MRSIMFCFALAACGGSKAQPASPPTARVYTEKPETAGAVGTAQSLPPEVTSLPPQSAPTEAAAAPSGPMSKLIGQAWFRGPECASSAWPPQCNGPYRRTWVWIWSHLAKQWLRSAQTDDNGNFTFLVEPGWYTIMFNTGFNNQWWYAKVNVAPVETTVSNLVVDWSQR